MGNPFINVGERMKTYIWKIVFKDFGKVSYAKGLYNIISLYNKYVPKSAKKGLRNQQTKTRMNYKKWT